MSSPDDPVRELSQVRHGNLWKWSQTCTWIMSNCFSLQTCLYFANSRLFQTHSSYRSSFDSLANIAVLVVTVAWMWAQRYHLDSVVEWKKKPTGCTKCTASIQRWFSHVNCSCNVRIMIMSSIMAAVVRLYKELLRESESGWFESNTVHNTGENVSCQVAFEQGTKLCGSPFNLTSVHMTMNVYRSWLRRCYCVFWTYMSNEQ